MRDNHLDMMKHLCSPIASCWFCASLKTIIWWQCLSSVGQWFPTDPVMWQWSAYIGPDLHFVMAEGYVGRDTRTEVGWTALTAQPWPTGCSEPSFHIKEDFFLNLCNICSTSYSVMASFFFSSKQSFVQNYTEHLSI